MAFKPGQSGNPLGRPKKLLKRVDEVLHERGIEPVAEVLKILDKLKRQRPIVGPAPERCKTEPEKRAWKAAQKAMHSEQIQERCLDIWLELLPYVYPRVREQADDGAGAQPGPEGQSGSRLRDLTDGELIRLVKKESSAG